MSHSLKACEGVPERSEDTPATGQKGASGPFNLIHRHKASADFREKRQKTAKKEGQGAEKKIRERAEKNPSEEMLGGDPQRGIGALPTRIERYGKARHGTDQMATFLAVSGQNDPDPVYTRTGRPFLLSSLAIELDNCSRWLAFRHYPTVDEVRLVKANFCKRHTLCPVCAIRRGSRTVQKYLPKFQEICRKRPDLKPALLTLTVVNGDDLSERMDHLMKAVRSFNERGRKARSGGHRHYSEAGKIAGAFGSYEVTHKGNGWHPHVHMLVMLTEWIDQKALSREWLSITGDSIIVDIRRVQAARPEKAFAEVCKYALKFSELSPADNVLAFLSLFAQRLTFSLGVFRGWEPPEDLLDEPLENLPYVEYFYRYVRRGGYTLERVEANNATPSLPKQAASPGKMS